MLIMITLYYDCVSVVVDTLLLMFHFNDYYILFVDIFGVQIFTVNED